MYPDAIGAPGGAQAETDTGTDGCTNGETVPQRVTIARNPQDAVLWHLAPSIAVCEGDCGCREIGDPPACFVSGSVNDGDTGSNFDAGP